MQGLCKRHLGDFYFYIRIFFYLFDKLYKTLYKIEQDIEHFSNIRIDKRLFCVYNNIIQNKCSEDMFGILL